MPRRIPIFYSALLLTGVNLVLRVVGTSFQVYVSRQIGPGGVGLLQLVMSVGGLAMVAGMAGVRTAAMYLTAEELGRDRRGNVRWVLSGCFRYSLVCSVAVALGLYLLAPQIAMRWIGDVRTVAALRLFGAFLPVSCLCGVLTGYFTAAGRIGTLSAVEIAEQLLTMGITVGLLKHWAGQNAVRACLCVILGSGLGGCLTLAALSLLRLAQRQVTASKIPVARRLRETALPLAAADVVRSGINTAENLMVPRRLALNPAVASPLGAFGLVSGMVFPVLMFPACILYALAELLIPELARCAAAGSGRRIRYLVRRSLKTALLYGLIFGGLEVLLADWLCLGLYKSPEAARFLRLYALLIPMLYCDAITDAMTKGLGQQKICVRYNILTSAMDVAFLYLLLPKYGMTGYFVSFFLTHLVNFGLSLRRLLKIARVAVPLHIPMLAAASALAAGWAGWQLSQPALRCAAFVAALGSLLCLTGVLGREELNWVKGLLRPKNRPS
ncbi:MAG: MATE family efflux transporter [Eubacteriales bacterium]|nr:MATE family efflux transporter [Eubacteriales bacterium]